MRIPYEMAKEYFPNVDTGTLDGLVRNGDLHVDGSGLVSTLLVGAVDELGKHRAAEWSGVGEPKLPASDIVYIADYNRSAMSAENVAGESALDLKRLGIASEAFPHAQARSADEAFEVFGGTPANKVSVGVLKVLIRPENRDETRYVSDAWLLGDERLRWQMFEYIRRCGRPEELVATPYRGGMFRR